MNENYLMGLGAFFIFFALVGIILWIWMMVYATKKKGWVGFLLTFFLGLIGWVIVLFLPADEKQERERERVPVWHLLYQV